MNNVIEIGWSLLGVNERYYFHEYRKKETMKTLFPFDTKENIPNFYYCPPVSEYYKNCFGYYAISDVNVLLENGNFHFLEGHKHSIPEVDGVPKVDKVFQTGNYSFEFLLPDEIFISDTPNVSVEILPHPFAKYKNIIHSKLDIYKWFRSIHLPYYHDNSMFHYQVKGGEPLCLIKFNTPNNESVKLVELDFNKIEKYCNARGEVQTSNCNQDLNSVKKWLKYFDIFSEKRPKKLIDYARIDK
jgi:hypothetical protein